MSLVKCGVTRDGLREQTHQAAVQRQCGASCKALKKAVSSLHRVDDFDLEYIGSGFFSHIYKVVHKITKQVMVLKKNIKSSNRANVRREIQLMNQLSHPNIIRFYGVCIIEGHMHALVEYINGGSLEQLLADKSMELPWALRIHLACDIAKGIKYLHSNGYMHRDLTSKNILIKNYSDGRTAAVVADLGLTDKIPEPDKQVASVGSPYWMAPECISGKKYNEKADVFSYGIVLCEIIARVEADPDILPRTKKFGVDYVEFSKMSSDCPLHLLHQAFICCQIEPSKRPSFTKIVSSLEEMKSSAQMAVILADLSRLGIVNSGKNVLNRMLLEKILDEKLKHRKRSADDGQHHSIMQTPPSYVVTSRLLHRPSLGRISPSNPSTDPSAGPTNRHHFVPVTPMIVGKVMSRDDVYYAPQQGNPFPVQFRGAKWINPSKDSSRNSFGSSSFDFGDSETDRGILDDCSEFLELHSPMDRLPRTLCSRQKSSDLRQSLHLNCYPPVVLHEYVGSPSGAAPLGRLSGRLQRSNSLPGSPSSLFSQSENKELSSSKTKTITSDMFKNNCSSNFLTDIEQTIRNKPSFEKTLVSEASDASEYGSSSLDSALGSDLAASKSRKETSDNVLLYNSLNNNIEPTQSRKRPEDDRRAVVQRRRHRISSASVCRSSSTVYPQTEEAALLARYFEIYRRDSSDSSRAQDGDGSSPFCDDEDDADEFCNYKHNNNQQQQSPIPFFLSDDSVLGTDDSFETRGQTDADLLPGLGSRDDATRRSRERFLELVRNWEGRVDVENAGSSSHFHVIGDETTGTSMGRPKLMEFAEFYLLRRFQELKQKWEKRQQMFNTGSKNPEEANRNSSACPTLDVCEKQLFDSSTSDETIKNSPEKTDVECGSAT